MLSRSGGTITDMKARVCVVGLVQNDKGDYLICKKPDGLGVYAGEWGIPGGGIEEGETMEEAFVREMKEEIGVEVTHLEPLWFSDDTAIKHYGDGKSEELYMIYLYFRCRAASEKLKLNREFEEYAWINRNNWQKYKIGTYTKGTLTKLGLISRQED